ncbi:hypothetical protein GCM10009535_23930 [Streptomyces thermocarboxydovorans]|uniref:Uncharacterized protein n=1 Tax=Streptomyces thermocarboxydovorans TaxID=59298 RepID=A0ABN1HFW7_9ACTN
MEDRSGTQPADGRPERNAAGKKTGAERSRKRRAPRLRRDGDGAPGDCLCAAWRRRQASEARASFQVADGRMTAEALAGSGL